MAYDLDRTELNHLLSPNIDPGAQAAVIDYLLKNGALEGDDDDDRGLSYGRERDDDDNRWGQQHHYGYNETVKVQETYDGVHLDPDAQVLDLTAAANSVTTDSALKVIVENTATDAHLTVHGADDVMIVGGAGDDSIDLSDTHGDDIVLGGRGNDSITGGHGADSIYGGHGNDTIHAGDGDYQLIVGGDGSDTLWGGLGSHDTVMGGNGHDEIHGGAGAYQLLVGGGSNDTMFAGVGDYDTVRGGDGDDLIHIAAHANGHDTVDGGSGNDTLKLDGRSTGDLTQPFHGSHGETVLHFTDGQTVTVSNVENIVFTDKTFHI
jgi:Ca2+-binding RTX toxin-like protein